MRYQKLFIIIFFTILLTPIFTRIFNIGTGYTLEENRQLSAFPKFSLSASYPKSFTVFFNDNFGLRNYLISVNRYLRYRLFSVSPDKAITIGKDNWLFYTPDVNYVDSVNGQAFSQTDLDQIKSNLQNIQNNFNKKGIKFYFLIAPNKQTIYPEYLPDYMKKVRPDSRLDQLDAFLNQDSSIIFINPKAELLKAKVNTPVYLKYDTHWNEMGAFVAYRKLMSRISDDFKNVKPKTINDFALTQITAPNKDLAIELGVPGTFTESDSSFTPKSISSKIVLEDCPKVYTGCPLTVREVVSSKLPKLVMFRDSFAAGLIPFMSEHFQRSYYQWGNTPYSTDIIDKEKPDIVIYEVTERELWRLVDKVFIF